MTREYFDRIITSAPVNAQAARQLGKGVEWTPIVKLQDYFADCPAMRGEDYFINTHGNPEFLDFRGKTFGRLSVVGVLVKDGFNRASWVCRCVCGGYCTRSAKSLKVAACGGNTFVDRCGRCEYQRKLANGWAPRVKA